METLYDISRFSDKEIKEILGEDEEVKIGSFVIDIKNKIYKIAQRTKDEVVVVEKNTVTSDYGKTSRTFQVKDINNVVRFNYSKYKELLADKYKNPGSSNGVLGNKKALVKYLKKTLYKIYGEERVDVSTLYGDSVVSVIIHFPSIIVQNSLEMSHKLRDVFLKLIFSKNTSNKWKLYSYSVYRSTYTAQEVASGYVFSHSNYICGEIVSSFCFGNTSFGEYENKVRREINPLDIPFFIQQFKSFLEWESIEGIPYRYISKISPFKMKETKFEWPTEEELNEVYNKLLNHLSSFTYDLINDSGIKAKVNSDDLVDKLYEIVPHTWKTARYGDSEGTPEAINKTNTFLLHDDSFYFKNEKIIPTIIEDEHTLTQKELEAKCVKTVHKSIIDHFKNRLDKEFTEFFIKHKLEND